MTLNRRTWMTLGLGLSLGLAQVAHATSPTNHPNPAPAAELSRPAFHAQGALSQNTWQLQRVQSGPRRAGQLNALPKQQAQRPVLRFWPDAPNQGRLSVTGLCNTMNGGYQIEGDKRIRMGQLMSTNMACANDQRMRLEREVGQQLPKLSSYTIRDKRQGKRAPELELQFSDGSRWYLSGTPTNEALYGEAQQIFLEVAPETTSCNHPLMPKANCLRVRELAYDEAGRKRIVSDWQAYQGRIQGFTHEAGYRKVLRIQRYKNPNPPADASSLIDVLDMVVETELVR